MDSFVILLKWTLLQHLVRDESGFLRAAMGVMEIIEFWI